MPVVVAAMTLTAETFVVVLAACEVATLLHELNGLVEEFLLLFCGGLAQAKGNVIVKLKLQWETRISNRNLSEIGDFKAHLCLLHFGNVFLGRISLGETDGALGVALVEFNVRNVKVLNLLEGFANFFA